MDDEDVKSETASQTPTTNPEVGEAQALSELKKQLDTLKSENQNLKEAKSRYYDAVLNGQLADPVVEKHRPIEDIKKDILTGVEKGITNLDYCTLAVELDNAVREDAAETGKEDSVFLPHGKDISPTLDEYNTADKMNAILTECINNSNGSPSRFNMELAQHMNKRP